MAIRAGVLFRYGMRHHIQFDKAHDHAGSRVARYCAGHVHVQYLSTIPGRAPLALQEASKGLEAAHGLQGGDSRFLPEGSLSSFGARSK